MSIRYPVLLGGVDINDDNKVIRMTEGASTVNLTIIDPATGSAIPDGTRRQLFILGDATDDDLCEALRLTFNSHTNATSPNTYEVNAAYSLDASAAGSTINVLRQTGSSSYGFLFGNAATTFDETLIGFSGDTAVDGSNKTSSKSAGAAWCSPEVYRSFEPDESYDATVVRADGGQARVTRTAGPFKDKLLELRMIGSRRALRDDNTSDPDATFAKFLERFGAGPRIRVITMPIDTGFALDISDVVEVGSGWYFGPDAAKRFKPTRVTPGLALYDWDVDLLGYVA